MSRGGSLTLAENCGQQECAKLKVLDIFSGIIGGFSLGLERTGGFKTVAFCEIEEFPRRVLAKHWPDVPIHRDVRELKAEHVGAIDLICGGFPCQPFSSAGKRGGTSDDRWLWPEMLRLISEARPRWVIGENVTHIDRLGLEIVLSDLEANGYEAAPPFEIPSCAVNREHLRFRTWMVGYSNRDGKPNCAVNDEASRLSENASDAECRKQPFRLQSPGIGRQREHIQGHTGSRPKDRPSRVGSNDGLPNRLDRLRGLGNAVDPAIPEILGRAILAAEGRA